MTQMIKTPAEGDQSIFEKPKNSMVTTKATMQVGADKNIREDPNAGTAASNTIQISNELPGSSNAIKEINEEEERNTLTDTPAGATEAQNV